jgi:hypothetical protein
MKLPNFLEFEPFNQLRELMAAEELGDFVFFDPHLNLTGHERLSLEQEGLCVEDNHFRVGDDFTLIYKDSRVLLVCPQPTVLAERYFHLAHCNVVKSLLVQGLQASAWLARTNVPERQEGTYNACSDCLQRLRYQDFDNHRHRHRDYSERVQQQFDLQAFFNRYPMYPVGLQVSAPIF